MVSYKFSYKIYNLYITTTTNCTQVFKELLLNEMKVSTKTFFSNLK